MSDIFRAYDIRGIVGETLTEPVVHWIGQAIGTQVLRSHATSVIVGCDCRLSSPLLKRLLIEGICSTGCQVIDIGMVPTPVVYYAIHALEETAGVMITGSHSPIDYNGFKIIIDQKALYGEQIQALRSLIEDKDFCVGQGSVITRNLDSAYIESIVSDMVLPKKLKVVVDAGNGVAGPIAQILYERLGCEVIPLYCDMDGEFPNHHPDPGQPANLKTLCQTVQEMQADLGLAFDGDGDRLGIIDNTGRLIWPDRALILFAKDILDENPSATVIFDVKCSRHVSSMIKNLGGNPIMWKTGHSLIKAKMRETGALLAGEMSGHFFFHDRWYGFDDALYAGARVLEKLSQSDLTLAEIFNEIPDSVATPELMLNTTEQDKLRSVEDLIALARFQDAELNTIDGLRVDFADGFGLVRCSNTGPKLVLRFEADSKKALQKIQRRFRQLLRRVRPHWILPF